MNQKRKRTLIIIITCVVLFIAGDILLIGLANVALVLGFSLFVFLLFFLPEKGSHKTLAIVGASIVFLLGHFDMFNEAYWMKVEQKFYQQLATFSTQDSGNQRKLIYEIKNFPDVWEERVIKKIKKDSNLLGIVEASLWKFAVEERGGYYGILLGKISSRTDPVFLGQCIRRAATLLDNEGKWKDVEEGRRLYDTLNSFGIRVVPVLTTEILNPFERVQILFLTVKLGIEGSEESLANALEDKGDKQMAEDYLNSGSEKLASAARSWAEKRGYSVEKGKGSQRVRWGGFL